MERDSIERKVTGFSQRLVRVAMHPYLVDEYASQHAVEAWRVCGGKMCHGFSGAWAATTEDDMLLASPRAKTSPMGSTLLDKLLQILLFNVAGEDGSALTPIATKLALVQIGNRDSKLLHEACDLGEFEHARSTRMLEQPRNLLTVEQFNNAESTLHATVADLN